VVVQHSAAPRLELTSIVIMQNADCNNPTGRCPGWVIARSTIRRCGVLGPELPSGSDQPRGPEGIVAKAAQSLYQPEKTTWVKIKNPSYSQATGRRDFFDVRRKPATRFGKTPLSLGENVG
jgi:hypothetical protein